MIERLIVAVVLALLAYLEKRHAESKTAVDADRKPDLLRRIGERVRKWEDGSGVRRQPAADRAGDNGHDLPAG